VAAAHVDQRVDHVPVLHQLFHLSLARGGELTAVEVSLRVGLHRLQAESLQRSDGLAWLRLQVEDQPAAVGEGHHRLGVRGQLLEEINGPRGRFGRPGRR
jgi:hypothetical protein